MIPDFSIRKIACGFCHTACISDNGNIYTFGNNQYSQLGLNHSENKYYPTVIDIKEKIIDLACSYYNTVFIVDTEELYTCGGMQISPLLHRIDNFNGVIQVSCGDGFILFINAEQK